MAKARVGPDLRWAVFRRDGYECLCCGAVSDLTADHVVPVAKGGAATLENLQTLCRSCNCRKSTAGRAVLERSGARLVAFRCELGLSAWVEGVAAELGVTRSSVIREALRRFMVREGVLDAAGG